MQCPVCRNQSMQIQEIESGLKVQQCPQCKGRWIGSYVYWKWKEATGKNLPDAASGESLEVNDSVKAKLCPECGYFLRRYPVGKDMDFALDRCSNCGGTWFDHNEWESLKSRGLHDDVHLIFSNMWQNRVRDEAHLKSAEDLYLKMFGAEDFERIRRVREWVNSHPRRTELKAFLNS